MNLAPALLIAAGAAVVYVVAQLLGAGQSLAVFLGILLPLLIGIIIRFFLAPRDAE